MRFILVMAEFSLATGHTYYWQAGQGMLSNTQMTEPGGHLLYLIPLAIPLYPVLFVPTQPVQPQMQPV